MRICPLYIPGREMIPGVKRACELGYDVMPIPGEVDVPLTDVRETGEYHDSVKQNVINLLRSKYFSSEVGPEEIYSEADFLPLISAADLSSLISRAPGKWEVLTLGPNGGWHQKGDESDFISSPEGIYWNGTYFNGTQGVIFRNARTMEMVIHLWEESRKPIDLALRPDKFYLYTPSKNLFIQNSHHGDNASPKDRRFLVYLQSYRRLKDAIRQVYSFLDQSYENFLIQLVLRGVDEWEWKKYFLPNLRKHVLSGRLIPQVRANGNQLENVIEAGMGINPGSYDLIAKVDDDDFYGVDYLAKLNMTHAHLSPDVGSYTHLIRGEYHLCHGYPTVTPRESHYACGGNFVLTKELIEVAREYVSSGYSPDILRRYLTEEEAIQDWVSREDNLLIRLGKRIGMVRRDAMINGENPFLYSTSGPSVLSSGLRYYLREYEDYLSLKEYGGRKDIRVFIRGELATEVGGGSSPFCGEVIEKSDGRYILRTSDRGDFLILTKGEDGRWEVER